MEIGEVNFQARVDKEIDFGILMADRYNIYLPLPKIKCYGDVLLVIHISHVKKNKSFFMSKNELILNIMSIEFLLNLVNVF